MSAESWSRAQARGVDMTQSVITELDRPYRVASSDLLDAQRLKMLRDFLTAELQNVIFDIFAFSVATLQVCTIGNKPLEQISVIKLCNLKYNRCAEFISRVDVKTLRRQPGYSLQVILHRQIVEHSL